MDNSKLVNKILCAKSTKELILCITELDNIKEGSSKYILKHMILDSAQNIGFKKGGEHSINVMKGFINKIQD